MEEVIEFCVESIYRFAERGALISQPKDPFWSQEGNVECAPPGKV
jgi:hypothetical protein